MVEHEYRCACCGEWHPSAVACPRDGRTYSLEIRQRLSGSEHEAVNVREEKP